MCRFLISSIDSGVGTFFDIDELKNDKRVNEASGQECYHGGMVCILKIVSGQNFTNFHQNSL